MNERDSSTCVRGINSPNAAIPWRLEHVISGAPDSSGGFQKKQIEPHMN